MKSFNPVLLAIAYKRTDLLKYFVSDMKVTLLPVISEPVDLPHKSQDHEKELFGLRLAWSNKDLKTLQYLSDQQVWGKEHLNSVHQKLIEAYPYP